MNKSKKFFFCDSKNSLCLKILPYIAQESLELLINICLTKLSDPTALNQEEQLSYQKLIELQKSTLNDIVKEFIRQVKTILKLKCE